MSPPFAESQVARDFKLNREKAHPHLHARFKRFCPHLPTAICFCIIRVRTSSLSLSSLMIQLEALGAGELRSGLGTIIAGTSTEQYWEI